MSADDPWQRLVSHLEGLDPVRREARIAGILDLLGLNGPAPAEPARGGPPVEICEWAADDGRDAGGQRLLVGMDPGPFRVPKTRAATGRSLVSNGYLGSDILHIPAGEGFAPHTHPGDHLLFVVGGQGSITVNGAITPTRAGQVYLIEGAVSHAVGAITDHVILAVGAPHRSLTSMDRQHLVAYADLMTPIGDITCSMCDVTARSGEELAAAGCPHSPHLHG